MRHTATTVANTAAILAGAHILRVHDVRPALRHRRHRRPHPRRRRMNSHSPAPDFHPRGSIPGAILEGEGKSNAHRHSGPSIRRPDGAARAYPSQTAAPRSDPRLAQLPDQIARLDARADLVRESLVQMRTDIAEEARRTREVNTGNFGALRTEVAANITAIGQTLKSDLISFREDNKTSSDQLRRSVETHMEGVAQRLSAFTTETTAQHTNLRESLNTKLAELMNSNIVLQERLRAAVEERLTILNQANTAKLEEMRVTVDEKLQATLNDRLTTSFGQVTTHLGEVQKGLGEMKELAIGVGDLKKVLSNVSRRGGLGEFAVGQQLEEMLSPEQYIKQANIKPDTSEAVDFALKFPNGQPGHFILLPIDAKFPTADWERLEHAYDHGTADEIASAGKAFERSIRIAGKSICDKYIDPPTTTPHAIMFLPTEGLYAEVVRRPGLQARFRATIVSPSPAPRLSDHPDQLPNGLPNVQSAEKRRRRLEGAIKR